MNELATEKTYNDMYLDEKEFESKFLLSPNIDEEEDYRHLDKNLSTTNFKSQLKEPEVARLMLGALHTITNNRYFSQGTKLVVKEYSVVQEEVQDEEGNTFLVEKEIPVYKQKLIDINRFPKTYHKLKAKFYSFTTTASARGGHLIKVSRTKNLRNEQTLDDKTANKTSFSFFKQKRTDKEDW